MKITYFIMGSVFWLLAVALLIFSPDDDLRFFFNLGAALFCFATGSILAAIERTKK